MVRRLLWEHNVFPKHVKVSSMENLLCKKCNEEKSVSNFSIQKDRNRGYHVWCKSCVKEYDKERHQKNKTKILKQKKDRKKEIRKWFDEYKSNLFCEECGENHPAVLDFHHLEEDSKDGNISDMACRGYSRERILTESKKCIVLCSNCHRKLHYKHRGLVSG
jgi:transcription elongation factor Elf1